jgi:hypothetical protein
MSQIQRRIREIVSLAIACGAIAIIGCGEAEITPNASTAIVEQGAGLPPDEAMRSASAAVGLPTPGKPTSASVEAPAAPVTDYQAPFPNRIDLFVAPKRQGTVRTEGGSSDAVDLVGFVRLDRQQAVLSINGQVTRIAEGGEHEGIEVISIQPPNVVLQRGRQRWQDSLEN